MDVLDRHAIRHSRVQQALDQSPRTRAGKPMGFGEDRTTDMGPEHLRPPPDPVFKLLQVRELEALRIIIMARFALIAIMAPMAWMLGTTPMDRMATLSLLLAYGIVATVSAFLVKRRRHLGFAGLAGVGLDVIIIAALPVIWYASLGGTALPAGIALKTSVTLMALLLIALNALIMRPLYPVLVTTGALLIHVVLVVAAWKDPATEFTSSYLVAYTTPAVATGRVVTGMTIIGLVGLLLSLLTLRARNTVMEAARLQRTNVQLGRYFSPNLVRKLSENPALFRVGGERKDVSIVFTDLQGFTHLVETCEPSETVTLLNDYLSRMIQVAFKHEGTVDKIVGDAVHVLFGAPVAQTDHAARAVACALEMDEVAEGYRKSLALRVPLGVTRIGVNSGPAMVGNFGGDALFDYTAYGDTVNVAARLEGANKHLCTRICVSAAAALKTPGFQGRPVGRLLLRGKTWGTEAFEPQQPGQGMSDLADYLHAYALLANGDSAAIKCFAALQERYPDDALVRFHLQRLKAGQCGTDILLDQY